MDVSLMSQKSANKTSAVELMTSRMTMDLPPACELLGISVSGGYKLAAKGEFPCRLIKIGARYVVPTADLRTLLGVQEATA